MSDKLVISGWDAKFLAMVQLVSLFSKDQSTQVGCVIVGPGMSVLAIGYNGLPRDVDDEVASRHERPEKYKWFAHAEENAIYNAARNGVSLQGASLYVGWLPCSTCARGVIQTGIHRVIIDRDNPETKDPERAKRWAVDHEITKQMFIEAGIEIYQAYNPYVVEVTEKPI